MITANKDGIIGLWQKTFGDEREYIENFIEAFSEKAKFLTKEKDGKTVSMLCMIECSLSVDSKEYKGRYTYACATDEEYKKQGLVTELLEEAKHEAENEDCDFLVLVPANDGLFDFYEKRGYERFFKVKELELSSRVLKILSKEADSENSADASVINEMRKSMLTKRPCILWSDEQIEFINNIYSSDGRVLSDKNIGYAFLREENETVYIDEICAKAEDFCKMLGLILKNTEANNYRFSLPTDCPLTSDNFAIKDKGMILPLKNKISSDGYIGLVME